MKRRSFLAAILALPLAMPLKRLEFKAELSPTNPNLKTVRAFTWVVAVPAEYHWLEGYSGKVG